MGGVWAHKEGQPLCSDDSFALGCSLALSRRLPGFCANGCRKGQTPNQVTVGSSPNLTSLLPLGPGASQVIFRYENRQLYFSCLVVYLDG